MSTIQEVSAEQLARIFHHYCDALDHDCTRRREESATSSWDRTPADERKLLVAAARLALLELATAEPEQKPRRKYFANPGEADWGC